MNRVRLGSRRGFGILEVVAISCILGIVALSVAILFKQLVLTKRYSQQKAAASNADMMIRSVLSNQEACKLSLAGVPTDAAYHPIVLKDSLGAALSPDVDPTLRIQSVEARINAPVSSVSFVRVKTIFEKLGVSMGAYERTRYYFANIVKDSGGAITTCLQTDESGAGLNLLKYEQYEMPITSSPSVKTIWMQHVSYSLIPAPATVLKLTYADTAAAFNHHYTGPAIPVVASGNKIMISTRLSGDISETIQCHSPAMFIQGHVLVTYGTTTAYKMGGWKCGNNSTQSMPPTMFDTVPGETYQMSFRAWMNRVCPAACPNVPGNWQTGSLLAPEIYIYHYLQGVGS